MLYPKFIIETDDNLGDCLIISKCAYHKDLVIDATKVKGGGNWILIQYTDTIILAGKSQDFGRAEMEDIKNCIDKGNVFSTPYLDDPIADKYNFDYDTGSEIIHLTSRK